MTTINDSFSGSGALGGSWTLLNSSDFTQSGGLVQCSNGAIGVAYWNANSFSGDQTAQIQVAVVPTGGNWGAGPLLKFDPVSQYHYYATHNGSRIFVSRVGGSTSAVIDTGNTLTIAAGDVIKLTAETVAGVLTLKLYQNSTLLGTYNDSSPLTGARIGMRTYYGDTSWRGDNYSGGDLVAAAGDLSGNLTLDDTAASGSLAPNASNVTGSVTLDDTVASGSLQIAGVSNIAGTVTLDDVAGSGGMGSAGSATIVSQPFKSTVTAQLMPNTTLAHAVVLRVSDRYPAVSIPSPVTGSDSRLTINSAGLTAGVDYMLAVWNVDGSLAGIQKVTAA